MLGRKSRCILFVKGGGMKVSLCFSLCLVCLFVSLHLTHMEIIYIHIWVIELYLCWTSIISQCTLGPTSWNQLHFLASVHHSQVCGLLTVPPKGMGRVIWVSLSSRCWLLWTYLLVAILRMQNKHLLLAQHSSFAWTELPLWTFSDIFLQVTFTKS